MLKIMIIMDKKASPKCVRSKRFARIEERRNAARFNFALIIETLLAIIKCNNAAY